MPSKLDIPPFYFIVSRPHVGAWTWFTMDKSGRVVRIVLYRFEGSFHSAKVWFRSEWAYEQYMDELEFMWGKINAS